MAQTAPILTERMLRTKLRAEGINMVFRRDGNSTSVLDNVSLEAGEGEFVCLLGPSGCGKSTMLNIIAGLLSPWSGEVRIDGQVFRVPDARRIFVFRECGRVPVLTV